MNCWEILGLEPTSDKKKIKQIYAAKLKTMDVEEDPLAFQILKEAFDSAIFLSGSIIESNRPIEKKDPRTDQSIADQNDFEQSLEIGQETELEKISLDVFPEVFPIKGTAEFDCDKNRLNLETNDFKNNSSQREESKESSYVEIFNQELTAIYEKKDFFADVEKWTPLFSNELEWSIDEHDEIRVMMQQFLLANYRVLSNVVINYLATFFDFDSFMSDYKTSDYFRYTWTEIKQVPPLSFEIYQEIPKLQRIEYFTNRYELFQIVDHGNLNESTWSERLNICKLITTKDYDLINLQISYLLLKDFRMEQEQTVTEYTTLLSESQSLKESKTCEFFSAYYQWVKENGSTNDVLKYDKAELTIPITIVNLLMGYIYFSLRRHSRVNECWEELSQKNPTLLRAEELAMLQPIEPVQILPKKEKNGGHYLWAIFLLIFALVKIGGTISKNSDRNSYKSLPDIQNMYSGERDFKTNYAANSLLELKESENIYEQFVYYFYIDREDEERANFIESNLVGQAKEMAENLTISELPEIKIDSRYDFHSSPDNVADYGSVTALTLLDDDEPFIILQEDQDENISNVFGNGWEVLPKDKFNALWADIQVRPMMSQKFFVVYYLTSEERKENLNDNPEYVTENIKKLLEKNTSIPIAKEFDSGTWQISQDEEDKLYTIINDENDQHRFILSYDSYGRVEHIFGEGWEKLDNAKQKLIYDNAEEKIGIF